MSARHSGIRQITALDCAKCRENRPNVLISQILINKLRIVFNVVFSYEIILWETKKCIKNAGLSTQQHRKQHQIKFWI